MFLMWYYLIAKGGVRMTDTLELEMAMKKKGYTKKYVASKLGLTQQGFLLKLNNKTEFKASEISKLCKLLDVNACIFIGK